MTVQEMAKKNYERGLWTTDMLRALVARQGNALSAADFEAITGEPYEPARKE